MELAAALAHHPLDERLAGRLMLAQDTDEIYFKADFVDGDGGSEAR